MKKKWIDAYMDTAERFAQLSSARRLHVGAVVVKDHRIISIGYNGMPAGWTNDCEEEREVVTAEERTPQEMRDIAAKTPAFSYRDGKLVTYKTKDEVIHAEANAITKLARDGERGTGADLFCTHAPCIHCAKLIYGAGIDKVYYKHTYRDTAGVTFLKESGVEVIEVE